MSLKLAEVLESSSLKELLYTSKMLLHLTVPELIELINKPIKEVSIVGNNHECTIICLKSLLQDIL